MPTPRHLGISASRHLGISVNRHASIPVIGASGAIGSGEGLAATAGKPRRWGRRGRARGRGVVIADVLLVVAMLGASVYGAVALPPNGMVPVDVGPGSALNWLPKRVGLVLWPAIGVVAYFSVGFVAVGRQTSAAPRVGLTIALALILAAHLGSVVFAVCRSGRP
jgi:hypothetical protein